MSARQLARLHELGHQVAAYSEISESSFARELDTDTVCLAGYIAFTELPPPTTQTYAYPPDWDFDRSTVNKAVREFLRLTEQVKLHEAPDYVSWKDKFTPISPEPAKPLGRSRSRSASVVSTRNDEPVTPSAEQQEQRDPATVRPIRRPIPRAQPLGRTARQLFASEPEQSSESPDPIVEPSASSGDLYGDSREQSPEPRDKPPSNPFLVQPRYRPLDARDMAEQRRGSNPPQPTLADLMAMLQTNQTQMNQRFQHFERQVSGIERQVQAQIQELREQAARPPP